MISTIPIHSTAAAAHQQVSEDAERLQVEAEVLRYDRWIRRRRGPVWADWFWDVFFSNVRAIERLSTSAYELGRYVRDHTPDEVESAAYE